MNFEDPDPWSNPFADDQEDPSIGDFNPPKARANTSTNVGHDDDVPSGFGDTFGGAGRSTSGTNAGIVGLRNGDDHGGFQEFTDAGFQDVGFGSSALPDRELVRDQMQDLNLGFEIENQPEGIRPIDDQKRGDDGRGGFGEGFGSTSGGGSYAAAPPPRWTTAEDEAESGDYQASGRGFESTFGSPDSSTNTGTRTGIMGSGTSSFHPNRLNAPLPKRPDEGEGIYGVGFDYPSSSPVSPSASASPASTTAYNNRLRQSSSLLANDILGISHHGQDDLPGSSAEELKSAFKKSQSTATPGSPLRAGPGNTSASTRSSADLERSTSGSTTTSTTNADTTKATPTKPQPYVFRPGQKKPQSGTRDRHRKRGIVAGLPVPVQASASASTSTKTKTKEEGKDVEVSKSETKPESDFNKSEHKQVELDSDAHGDADADEKGVTNVNGNEVEIAAEPTTGNKDVPRVSGDDTPQQPHGGQVSDSKTTETVEHGDSTAQTVKNLSIDTYATTPKPSTTTAASTHPSLPTTTTATSAAIATDTHPEAPGQPSGEPGHMDLASLPPLPSSQSGTPRVMSPVPEPSPTPALAPQPSSVLTSTEAQTETPLTAIPTETTLQPYAKGMSIGASGYQTSSPIPRPPTPPPTTMMSSTPITSDSTTRPVASWGKAFDEPEPEAESPQTPSGWTTDLPPPQHPPQHQLGPSTNGEDIMTGGWGPTTPQNGTSYTQAPNLSSMSSSLSPPQPTEVVPSWNPQQHYLGGTLERPSQFRSSSAISIKSPPLLPQQHQEEKQEPPTFSITLSDPTKIGDPIRGHVVYTITTRTSSPLYSRKQFSVLRRFSDFLWLVEVMSANNPGVIVPPVPDKHAFGRFDETFIETRRAALEKSLNKIANHPVLGLDPDLKLFLESDSFAVDVKHRKAETPMSAHGGLLAAVGTLAGPKFVENDQWFEDKKSYVDTLESQLKSLVKAIESTSKHRIELVSATSDLQDAFTDLSECDLATDLTTAIQRLAELTRREKEGIVRDAREEIDYLLSLCDEYIRLVGSIRLAFASRIRSYTLWKNAEADAHKARATHEKMRKQGKIPQDRLQYAVSELAENDRRAIDAHSEFEAVTRLVKVEFSRFEVERVEEFKRNLEEYVDSLIDRQRELIESWETYHLLVARMVAQSQGRE